MLLRGRAEGLSASFLDQPVELPDLRTLLAYLLGTEAFPQALLRMGYGDPLRPQPRRTADAVLRT